MKYLLRSIKPLLALSLVLTGVSVAPPAQATSGCTAGSYAAPYDASICIPAQPGYFVATGAVAPTACLPGTYQPQFGAISCLDAAPGYYVGGFGNTYPYGCLQGTYQPNPKATGCIPASPGRFVDKHSSSSDQACPAATGSASINTTRTSNSFLIECYVFSESQLVLPQANTSYSSSVGLYFSFHARNGIGNQGSTTFTFTKTDNSATYQVISSSYGSGGGENGYASLIPKSWDASSTYINGCLTSCPAGSEITSIPTGTYNIVVSYQNQSNANVNLSVANVTIAGDLETLRPQTYWYNRTGFETLSSNLEFAMVIGEQMTDSSVKLILSDGLLSEGRALKTRTFTLDTEEPGSYDFVIALDGTATDSPLVVDESGDPITPGLWWFRVTARDTANPENSAIVDEYFNIPILITRDCPSGNFSVNGIAPCIPSPAGYFVNYPSLEHYSDVTQAFFPSPCGRGSYQPNPGSTECLPADPGTYVDESGSTATTDCPVGKYQPSTGSIACIEAEAGTYVNQPGSTATTDCAEGTYQPDAGNAECLPAEAGSYTNETGSTELIPCATGMYQPTTGQTFCLRAAAGHYVPSTGLSSQTECDSGTYQPSPGAVDCLPADPGTYVDEPGSAVTTDCSVGTYQPDAGAAECIPAEAGSYTNETGSVATTLCDAGSYQSEAGQTSCVLASANHFVASAGQVSQTPCASGYGQPNIGSTSCDAIPALGNSTPVVCPALTYSSVGATSIADCKPKPCVVKKGKSANSACMLASIAKVLPAKAKVTIKMSKSFKKICKVNKTRVKALKVGTCTVTITVKPKKGKSIKYKVNVTGI